MFFGVILPFLFYWLVLFVVCYAVVEYVQYYIYDEVVANVGWRIAGGTFLLAALATWLRPSFETMFTSDIHWTLLQAIVWFLVFTFVFQFQPWHGAAVSVLTLMVILGAATMGVDRITGTDPAPARARARPERVPPPRRATTVPPKAQPPAELEETTTGATP